jgi:hypothetical protein
VLNQSRLKQFETNSTFNRTRLKNKLLLKIPELKPFHKGRELEVLLVFEKNVGPALVSACDYTDAMYLAKASEIVRREIFAEQNKFSGHFDRDSVPHCLVELQKPVKPRALVLCEMVLALGFLTAIYFSDGFC